MQKVQKCMVGRFDAVRSRTEFMGGHAPQLLDRGT